MPKQCYGFRAGSTCASSRFTFKAGNSASVEQLPVSPPTYVGKVDGAIVVSAPYVSVEIYNCSVCGNGACLDVGSPTNKFDCVNGGCVPNGTYNTPGIYVTLAACQAACRNVQPCEGECISLAELAALQQAAGNVRPRICG